MKTKRLANKIAISLACVLALAGTVISCILLVDSVKYGIDWYRFIPAVLYILCFVDLIAYATTGIVKSVIAFRAVLVNYALVVIFTGILFPPVYPHGTKTLFLILAIFIVLGLTGFHQFWSKVKVSQIFLAFAFVAECASALASFFGNPMLMDENFVAQITLFIRPLILGTTAVCYLARMYEKKHSEK